MMWSYIYVLYLVGVGENGVSCGDLLELLGGLLVARVLVGVVLHRQLPVRALYLALHLEVGSDAVTGYSEIGIQ